MKEIKNVVGSQKTVPAVEVGKTTVYVRTNIRPHTEVFTEDSVFTGWMYDEEQYSIEEYFALYGEKILTLENTVRQLEEKINLLKETER